jgi:chromosome segregation ATPase
MVDPFVEACSMMSNPESMSTNPNAAAHSSAGANITYATALNDAKSLIVQQSARIKSDAQRIKAQAEEIAQVRSAIDAMTLEMDRLRAAEARLAEASAAREQAEALVGRQRMEIESLETASRELQRMLGEQAARINELTAEAEHLRAHVPTDEDAAALEQMAMLLANARAGAKSRQQRADQPAPAGRLDRMAGPALAQQHHERLQAASQERKITIPVDPTPFCVVNGRQAA